MTTTGSSERASAARPKQNDPPKKRAITNQNALPEDRSEDELVAVPLGGALDGFMEAQGSCETATEIWLACSTGSLAGGSPRALHADQHVSLVLLEDELLLGDDDPAALDQAGAGLGGASICHDNDALEALLALVDEPGGRLEVGAAAAGPARPGDPAAAPHLPAGDVDLGVEVEHHELDVAGQPLQLAEAELELLVTDGAALVDEDADLRLVVASHAWVDAGVLAVAAEDRRQPVGSVAGADEVTEHPSPVDLTVHQAPDLLLHLLRDTAPAIGTSVRGPLCLPDNVADHAGEVLPLLIGEVVTPPAVVASAAHHEHHALGGHLLHVFALHQAGEVVLAGQEGRERLDQRREPLEAGALLGRQLVPPKAVQRLSRQEDAPGQALLGECAVDVEVGRPVPHQVRVEPPAGAVVQGEVQRLVTEDTDLAPHVVCREEERVVQELEASIDDPDARRRNVLALPQVEEVEDASVEGLVEDHVEHRSTDIEARCAEAQVGLTQLRELWVGVRTLSLPHLTAAGISASGGLCGLVSRRRLLGVLVHPLLRGLWRLNASAFQI